jgi:glycerophosphoryl diester phosphodiesterase
VSRDWDVRLAGIDRVTKGGRTPSDHFPVFAVLRPAQPSKTLRVLSYNLHHCEGTDGKLDVPRIARVIRDADPDVVALQEVDDKTKRTGGVDQTAELARLTGLHGRFGKAIDYQGGGYGQAILSRFPLGDVKVHALPGEPEREQRVAVEAKLTADGRELSFVTTHLHHASEPFRVRQAAKLNELFADPKHPVILAGDMNATPASEPLKVLGPQWANATAGAKHFTFPAGVPKNQIDYVLFRPAAAYVAGEPRVIAEPVASDHRPILAVLSVAPASPTSAPAGVLPPYAKPTCIAHRGASADAPEHTHAAYKLALEQGADFVEPDLQMTKDGQLVCLHDKTLERTTDVAAKFPDRAKVVKGRKAWPVADFTLAEVQSLDAGSWKGEKFAGERVPTFRQMIDAVKGKAGIIPETKSAGASGKPGDDMEAAVMATLKETGLDKPGADPKTPVIIQSFSAESLKKLRNSGCTLPLVYLFSEGDTSPAGLTAIKDFADGIAPAKPLVLAKPQRVSDAHALGLSVTVWTCRAGQTGRFASVKDEMRHLLRDLKVDAIFTDNPGDFPRD